MLDAYRERFRYILVDEYQDTNQAQYEWLQAARRAAGATCAASATTTSRSTRGAAPRSPTSSGSSSDFPGAKIIRLEQNYRSTAHILAAADGLIAHNAGRLGKTLWTDAGDGEKVRVDRRLGRARGSAPGRRGDRSAPERAASSLDDVAILVRAQFQTREFEERFIAIGLTYQIIGGFRFYERAEIRDAIAYLRLIVQPADDLAFERIVNQPKRGLGDKAIATIHRHARASQQPLLLAAAALLDSDELTPQARRSLGNFVADIARWRQMAATLPHPELARILLDEIRLHRDAPGRPLGRKRRPARKPRRAHARDGRI